MMSDGCEGNLAPVVFRLRYLQAAAGIDKDGSLHYQLARAYQAAGETESEFQIMPPSE